MLINTLRRIEELRSQISLSYEEYSEKRLLMKEVYNNLMSDLYKESLCRETSIVKLSMNK